MIETANGKATRWIPVPFRRRRGVATLTISLAATLPYLLGLSHGFVAEDFDVLFVSALSPEQFLQFHMRYMGRLRFLASIKDWLLYRIAGAEPIVYHAGSLILHLIASLLLYHLVKRLSRDRRAGQVAALLFAVYPRHHGTVMWLAAGQFLLSGVFLLAGLLLFTHYLSSRRWPHLVLASISFALALFSNEVSVIALPLTLMTEWVWARQRGSAIKAGPGGYDKYAIWLGFVALVAFMSLAGPRAFRLQPGTLDPRQRFETYQIQGISLALAKEMVSYITYMIWPQILLWDLGVDAGSLALAVATLAGTLLLLARGTRHERLFISWALLALVPIVLFVPFGVADRYFYVAAMGLTAALGSAGVRLWDLLQTPRSLARWLPGAMLAMYLVTSVVALQVRALEWHRAGQMARDIVSQIIALQPEVPSNSHMFFVGLPARYGQAYIYMGGGIGSAIRMAYGDYRIQVYRSVDPDLKQWLDRAPDGISREGVYLFVYRDGVMEDHSGRVNDVKTFLNDWWWYH